MLEKELHLVVGLLVEESLQMVEISSLQFSLGMVISCFEQRNNEFHFFDDTILDFSAFGLQVVVQLSVEHKEGAVSSGDVLIDGLIEKTIVFFAVIDGFLSDGENWNSEQLMFVFVLSFKSLTFKNRFFVDLSLNFGQQFDDQITRRLCLLDGVSLQHVQSGLLQLFHKVLISSFDKRQNELQLLDDVLAHILFLGGLELLHLMTQMFDECLSRSDSLIDHFHQ